MLNPLPKLLSYITGPRYIPKIEWISNNWTHNVFRVYEMIFGRKQGVRCEVTADSDGNYTFHTFEARIAHFEGVVRKIIATELKKVNSRFYSPELQLQKGAIGNNTSGINSTQSSTPSVSLTLSGSDRLLIIAPDNGSSDAITGTTWNTSETGTFIVKMVPGGLPYMYLYYVADPTATTANAAASSSNADARIIASSYTGADTIGASTTDSQTNSATFTINITTTAANSFIVAAVGNNEGNANTSTDGNVRQSAATGRSFVDKLIASAGASSVDISGTGFSANTDWDAAVAEIKAVAASGPTNVKTFDGVTQSTGVKTYFGVTVANTKSVNGIT